MKPTQWDPFKRPSSEWQCPIIKKLPSGEWSFPFTTAPTNLDSSPKTISKSTAPIADKPTLAESISPSKADQLDKCECLSKRKLSANMDGCPCKRDKKESPSTLLENQPEYPTDIPSYECRSKNIFSSVLRPDSNVKEGLLRSSVANCEHFESATQSQECSLIMQQTLPPDIEIQSAVDRFLPKPEYPAKNTPPDAEQRCPCLITNNASGKKRDRSFMRKSIKVKFDCATSSPPIAECECPMTNDYSPEVECDCTISCECPTTMKPPDARWECPIIKNADSNCQVKVKPSPAECEGSFIIQQSGYENKQSSEKSEEPETWRQALFGIAAEVQRFFCTNMPKKNNVIAADVQSSQYDDKNIAIENHRLQLKCKQEELSNLKGDIRKACVLAKAIITAKEKIIKSLTNDRNDARKQAIDLQDQINGHIEVVKRLSVENQVLSDKFENLTNFINLGYRELQKINGEIAEDVPVTIELKNIIVSCGKYYADYFNERHKFLRVSQKNVFLSNKIKALENLLQSNLSEVTEVRHNNCRLLNENKSLKNKIRKLLENNKNNKVENNCCTEELFEESPLITIQRDVMYLKDELSILKLNLRNNPKRRCSNQDVCDNIRETGDDRTSTVATLFRDQALMLQELKKISRELLSESNVNYVKCSHKVNENKVRFQHSIPKSVNENISIFGYPMPLNNVVFRSSGIVKSFAPSPPKITVNPKEQGQMTKLNEPLMKTSNTLILYRTDENLDEKSTLCGITSEMKELIMGRVATQVEVFENIPEDKLLTEKKNISSI